mmetsp:Transcript_35262/g.85347  ORF Transcript_35262/g.85347 Transcript_35262/m.85347 type:complete len:628 (-) Transcript_35262:248-2131(-)|eukprot:CAMPEP_0113466740 /NCGR_PEP_ID=MMETSP0014_2-20120614/14437_1 /TAXON_ID=2857 /ORGANISM="Nitzschia sp." /LENGTH=627 /DNA_ID=CAMNT_0000358991 /DNA_START=149 /DNA_END=2032 /DNA_ORIENTATION=- /assembly_acc=CAM_ASM_000159
MIGNNDDDETEAAVAATAAAASRSGEAPAAGSVTGTGTSSIKKRLQDTAVVTPLAVEQALGRLDINESFVLSTELETLKNLEGKEMTLADTEDLEDIQDVPAGMKVYSLAPLEGSLREDFLDLDKRKSGFYVERSVFSSLYDAIMEIWNNELDAGKGKVIPRHRVILTGNAGIGKSWFQVYVLRRLLSQQQEEEQASGTASGTLFDFVVRQVGSTFELIDLQSCSGYKILNNNVLASELKDLLTSHGKILYMFEPMNDSTTPPFYGTLAALSSLSPNPRRIKEYVKQGTRTRYMPVWTFDEMKYLASFERIPMQLLQANFRRFGGIVRHCLETDVPEIERLEGEVKKRCKRITLETLSAFYENINEDPNGGTEDNISGFVASYADIPTEGENSFQDKTLVMTSEFVRELIRERLNLKETNDYLSALLEHLKRRRRDITGMALENSVVHLLAAGKQTVKWEYVPVGTAGGPQDKKVLDLNKRDINRNEKEFDSLKLHYPNDKSFPLIDSFAIIEGKYWAFQTTWQKSHAFKLRTLYETRQKLGLVHDAELRILFVNPDHFPTYVGRAKNQYLVKGEQTDRPLLKNACETLLDAQAVANMWENTHIYVARPEDGKWNEAVETLIQNANA